MDKLKSIHKIHCLFCGTDACTCASKLYTRCLFLADHINKLKAYNQTHTLSTSDKKIWHMMYDQAKEELRTSELLITFKPYHHD